MRNLPFAPEASHLSVKQVSVLLHVCPKTVRRWIKSGALPASRIGRDWRIAKADLKALLATRVNMGLTGVL